MRKSAKHTLVLSAALVLVIGGRWLTVGSAPQTTSARPPAPPSVITLTGTIRDFKGWNETGGHRDFENVGSTGSGHFYQVVNDQLGADGKPTFRSGGAGVTTIGKNALGQAILSGKSYLQSMTGDVAAVLNTSKTGVVSSSASFNQWFNDVAGVNQSKEITLTLNLNSSTGTYIFDDRTDPTYTSLGGFFPINNTLFGNSPGQTKNYGFTLELQTKFTYYAGQNQTFTFSGDDDVWVFINGKLVIDLGGIHGRLVQTINLDRISGLTDLGQYTLAVFFAERHITSSNFRIETTLALQSAAAKPRITTWTESEPQP